MVNLKIKTYNKFRNEIRIIDYHAKEDCGHILLPFTGVLDKNGREIYYKDIYRRKYHCGYKSSMEFIIDYEGGGFFLGDEHLIDVDWENFDYIGNELIQC